MKRLFVLLTLLPGYLPAQPRPGYRDVPFLQDYAVRYPADSGVILTALATDRHGSVRVRSSAGLLQPRGGQLLWPGTLAPDRTHRPLHTRPPAGLVRHAEQLVFVDGKSVWSNAWAGTLERPHALPGARLLAGGTGRDFLISDGRALHWLGAGDATWTGTLPGDSVVALCGGGSSGEFWVLGRRTLAVFSPKTGQLTPVATGTGLTACALAQRGTRLVVTSGEGYREWDTPTRQPLGDWQRRLPWTELTAVAELDGRLWFGSTRGAFARRPDGTFDYYAGPRWLPGDHVVQLAAGTDRSVWVLTTAGLTQLRFEPMTLRQKAAFYDRQVRERHLRFGFNATRSGLTDGDVTSGYLDDSDNDGLWTAMYLASQAFRYAVTKEADALANCRESLDAMQRLYTLTPVPGFPARSFERSGMRPHLADPERWQPSADPAWDWKSTTSSDEVIGHVFVFGVIAELVDDPALKRQAITLLDTVMSHIVRNDLYLVDFDGKPTQWGRWNPAYVNGFPTNVGDRKLNSSNLIAMLQTAYRFTGKEKYRDTAFRLLREHGYLTNLLRPMAEIGTAPAGSGALAADLSDGWNHSDDEMYFLGYWGLYRYAFNDTLRAQYRRAILDHWQAERPEKDGLWNLMTALTGVREFDLDAAGWYLRAYPLDLLDWGVTNSHRRDVDRLPDNFRRQTLRAVLPPDELPIRRHNANRFSLDQPGRGGTAEYSAGDIWLLPYWLGRYLRVIGE